MRCQIYLQTGSYRDRTTLQIIEGRVIAHSENYGSRSGISEPFYCVTKRIDFVEQKAQRSVLQGFVLKELSQERKFRIQLRIEVGFSG